MYVVDICVPTGSTKLKRIDFGAKHQTTYCIPLWLRDVQIRLAINRPIPRLQPIYEKRPDPIAVVCYGPSLNETWEGIRGFKWIISCSGAHRFLIDRGIIPTWDVTVDPRAHKTKLIGEPHKDVTYLVSSTCHPAVFDHLKDYNVVLWHVFDSAAEALRILPATEWAICGGSSVGLRALTLARFLGFTDLHVFGMDGNSRSEYGQHAAAHPNQAPRFAETEYGGRTYLTTTSMLEVAKQTTHELDQMPDVSAKFYGEGLVQAIMQDYVPNHVPKEKSAIGFVKPELISESYRELNRQLHETNPLYGVGGSKYAETVVRLADAIGTRSILDYGCGKGTLANVLAERGIPIWEYDPAIAGKAEPPRPADLVIATDLLEHIEPDHILAVLDDLARVTLKCGYFVIHTGKSTKTLADGRNAHVLVRDHAWWRSMLSHFFHLGRIFSTPPLLHVVVAPKSGARQHVSVVRAGPIVAA